MKSCINHPMFFFIVILLVTTSTRAVLSNMASSLPNEVMEMYVLRFMESDSTMVSFALSSEINSRIALSNKYNNSSIEQNKAFIRAYFTVKQLEGNEKAKMIDFILLMYELFKMKNFHAVNFIIKRRFSVCSNLFEIYGKRAIPNDLRGFLSLLTLVGMNMVQDNHAILNWAFSIGNLDGVAFLNETGIPVAFINEESIKAAIFNGRLNALKYIADDYPMFMFKAALTKLIKYARSCGRHAIVAFFEKLNSKL